jgi:RNA polymerase sigma-70 factor (ECF subfamily)
MTSSNGASQVLSTSDSLLQRACRLDPAAWERLCSLYGPIIYGWCRQQGLQDSDAADAVQEVFRSVFLHLKQFRSGGGAFHRWLWKITLNQVRLHFRRAKQKLVHSGAGPMQDWPEAAVESEPDATSIRSRIVRAALDLIRGDFSEQTWQIFVRTTLQGESCQDVATSLHMSTNAVRQARFRVLRRLRQELDGLL